MYWPETSGHDEPTKGNLMPDPFDFTPYQPLRFESEGLQSDLGPGQHRPVREAGEILHFIKVVGVGTPRTQRA
jgi:hypothetical protein